MTVDATLVVRKTIRASPARVFAAWTTPTALREWWGPPGVACTHAAIDLRVGGRYRIDNRLVDGSTLTIEGTFEVVDPPHRLTYSWEVADTAPQLVTVEFRARDTGTEVVVTHTRIASPDEHRGHERGWVGCLAGLATFCDSTRPPRPKR